MRPLLYSCWWHAQFSKLAPVLQASAWMHCPAWEVRVEQLERPKNGLRSAISVSEHENNTYKLDRWRQVVNEVRDGTPVLLIDADAVILRPLDPVWDREFDVAYTTKPIGSRFPLNGGVVFLRGGARSRLFMRAWAERNRAFLRDRRYKLSPERRIFGGINQAALGAILRDGVPDVRILQLPCTEWNCEDETWEKFGPDTRILHIKGGLRREVLRVQRPRPTFVYASAVGAWKQMEQFAITQPAAVSPVVSAASCAPQG